MLISSILLATLLTNASQIAAAYCKDMVGSLFSMTGVVVNASTGRLMLIDDSGSIQVVGDASLFDQTTVSNGCIVSIRGTLRHDWLNDICYALYTDVNIISNTAPIRPMSVSASDLLRGKAQGRPVQITGTVRECFEDEIDANCLFFVLNSSGEDIYVSLSNTPENKHFLSTLTDCRILVKGICSSYGIARARRTIGPFLTCDRSDIDIIRHPPSDPFCAPLLSCESSISPILLSTNNKMRVIGTVLASWNSNNTLLVTDQGTIHNIRFRANAPSPKMHVEAVGRPETDLFRINLTDAIWRSSSGEPISLDTPRTTNMESIYRIVNGQPIIRPSYHGKLIRLKGTILDKPNEHIGERTFYLRCDASTVPVNICSCIDVLDNIPIGSTISVTGVCFVETEPWRRNSPFPHVTGISLITRSSSDIELLSRPPWWTPQRLLVLVSSLILALIVVIIWNRGLNRLVSRRSRALVKEQLALAEAELKIGERTRLAIELHDSLSQNLAAVACQVAATKSAISVSADETIYNLNTVERMLLSCRTELRRCLWDLRNDALDEQNMTDVIRKVLAPVLGKAELQVRFNVARTRLDDSTLHSVICIIRELTSNAVMHGQATHLTVAGDLDGEILAFSVRENGCGFDASACNGPTEGHFGLAGIRERVDRLCGTFTLKSQPGNGSYAKITFRLTSNDVEG